MRACVKATTRNQKKRVIRCEAFTHVLIYAFTALSALCFFHEALRACPGCKEALLDPSLPPQKLSTARGYALSIGLLLAVPAVLIGGMTLAVLRASRRRGG